MSSQTSDRGNGPSRGPAKSIATSPPDEAATPLVEGVDYEMEDGLFVLTAAYLRERGFCCGNGCRHCPFGGVAERGMAERGMAGPDDGGDRLDDPPDSSPPKGKR